MNKNLKSTVFLLLLFSLLLSMQDPGLAQRRSKKGWLGVSVREMTPSMRKEFDLGDRGGLLIDDVIEDSPADDARLWEDDIILEYNGQPVEFADEFSRMVRKTAPETKVKLLIWRDGKEKEVEVTLGRNRSRRQMVWSGTDLQVFSDRPRLGVQVHDLDADLAEYFKVKENAGVLIIEVAEDSPAEDAGLKAGDVITKLDKEAIADQEDLLDILEDFEDGDEITIEFVRKGKTETVQVELEGSGWRGLHFDTDGRHGLLRVPEFPQIRYSPRMRLDIQRRHEIRHAPKMRIEIKGNARVI